MAQRYNRPCDPYEDAHREMMRLSREATDLTNSTVWYDPRIDAEWRDVSQTYFPDWQAEVGCPFVIFLAGRLIDNGEPYEGLVEPDLPLILLDAGMAGPFVSQLTEVFELVRYGNRTGRSLADRAITLLEGIQATHLPAAT